MALTEWQRRVAQILQQTLSFIGLWYPRMDSETRERQYEVPASSLSGAPDDQTKRMPAYRILEALGVLLVLTGLGCAISQPDRRTPPPPIWNQVPGGDSSGRVVVDTARSLIGLPYRYGGRNRRGFDCSGLTWYVWNRLGRSLPRKADEQARVGSWIPLDELQPGDLLFFGPTREAIDHVGIVASEPGNALLMVHASTSIGVVETSVTGSSYWLQRLRFGRRLSG